MTRRNELWELHQVVYWTRKGMLPPIVCLRGSPTHPTTHLPKLERTDSELIKSATEAPASTTYPKPMGSLPIKEAPYA